MANLNRRLTQLEMEQGRAQAKMLVLDLWQGEESDQALREHLEAHPEHEGMALVVFLRRFCPRTLGAEREAKVYSYQGKR
jgi:hypothetical protein